MTSTLSTTTLDKRPDWFEQYLVTAGFSRENPNNILLGQSSLVDQDSDVYYYGNYYEGDDSICIYYEWKTWAQTRGDDDHLPIFTAARNSLKWYYMEQIFATNMPVINEIDVQSGLPLFALAAVGLESDIESVYNLLKEFPGVVSFNKSQ